MSTQAPMTAVRAVEVEFRDDKLWITLADGRIIGMPLSRYPWLQTATPEARAEFRIGTHSILWESLEDGIDIEGLLSAQPLTGHSPTVTSVEP